MLLKDYRVRVNGPLQSLAEGFARELVDRGYAHLSIRNQLHVFAFASRWMETSRLQPQALRSKQVAAILRSRKRLGYTCWLSARGLAPMLAYLRKLGAIPEPLQPRENWRTRLLDRYTEYLRTERGLATDTIAGRLHTARAFLSHLRGARSARCMHAAVVRKFFRRHVRGFSSPSAGSVATALRSFLRFLHVIGEVDSSLTYAVPSIAGWRLARLPRGIGEQVVKRLLRGCDRRTTTGLRDYAILMLLTRLGLRRCEVARLTLEDVDWRAGELAIHGKGTSIARLPLPADVGSALAAYAQRRGTHSSRGFFLHARVPGGSLHAVNVGTIVQSVARRADVEGVSAHRLRHTVATQMLSKGSSLTEIAQVLRHKSITTTAIYAKVDRATLRVLAQPWPGGTV